MTALAGSVGRSARLIRQTPFPPDFEAEIRAAYAQLAGSTAARMSSWAVRSSATAEDLPDASFAGQQETFLNVRGIDERAAGHQGVFASLYNDRAIAYRVHHGFDARAKSRSRPASSAWSAPTSAHPA